MSSIQLQIDCDLLFFAYNFLLYACYFLLLDLLLQSCKITLMETKKQSVMKTYIVRWVDVANLAMGSTPVVAKSVREVYKHFANTYGKTAKITALEVTL